MKVLIGIVSWLPDENEARELRWERLLRLRQQISDLWPEIPVLILAQNWKDKTLPNTTVIYEQRRLGILKARQRLRNLLLQENADYYILFDDDAIIHTEGDNYLELLKLMEENPQGWAFSEVFPEGYERPKYNPFAPSQLNLCCLSHYIMSREPIPEADPEKDVAFEDRLYSMTILCKYPKLQFHLPEGLYCTHFRNTEEAAPSTWARAKKHNWKKMCEETERIERGLMYLHKYKK